MGSMQEKAEKSGVKGKCEGDHFDLGEKVVRCGPKVGCLLI